MSLRVLHIVRSLRRETGGLAEVVRQLVPAMRERGCNISVASLDPADAHEELDDRSKVVVLGTKSHGYGYAPDYVPWMRAKRHEFDMVVVHGLWQYPSFGAWRALHKTSTPYIVYPHGMLDPWFKQAHPAKHAKKWLYWPWAEYRVLRDAAAVCFTAEDEQRRARESFWLYRARERVAPIGIAAPPTDAAKQREAFFASYPEMRGRRFILFLGRIHPKKAIELILSGYAAAWPDRRRAPRLVIAGPSDEALYERNLRAEVQRLGLMEMVVWLPMLSGEVKWGAIRACEAFALFSHQENFGVAVVEALACGRPVLISDRIAIHQEISKDGAGVVGADTTAGAAEALTRWRDLDETERAAMSTSAERCFRNRFEIGHAAAQLVALIKERAAK